MKIRFLLLLLSICLFSIASFGQEKSFAIEILLKENNRFSIGKDNLAKVKITNKSEQVLNTQDLKSISFYLSKCPRIKKCSTREDVYVASSPIELKNLSKDESLEFNVNLADLYWNSIISSHIDFTYPKNFNTVPFTNKYFYGDIIIFDKYVELKEFLSKIPLIKSHESNEIILDSKFKSAK